MSSISSFRMIGVNIQCLSPFAIDFTKLHGTSTKNVYLISDLLSNTEERSA